jgi:uncharacterized protein (TIGR03067 family)
MTIEEPTQQPASPPASSTPGEAQTLTPVPAQQVSVPQHPPRRLGKIAAFVLLLAICGGAIWYWGIYEPEPKDDLGRFQGDWKLTIGDPGENTEEDESPPRAIRITGDRWQFLASGKEIEGKTFRITLNESATPKEIELTLLDATGNPIGSYRSRGVYTIDRKTARVLVEPVNKPRPTNLDNPGPDANVWVLTKVKLQLLPTQKN